MHDMPFHCVCEHDPDDDESRHDPGCLANDEGPLDDDWIEAGLDATYRAIAHRERLWKEARMGYLK
jgi:hypothetical protein